LNLLKSHFSHQAIATLLTIIPRRLAGFFLLLLLLDEAAEVENWMEEELLRIANSLQAIPTQINKMETIRNKGHK
jgi:predicted flavoprotein YhiN